MKLYVALILFLFITSTAFASNNISGTWKGTGALLGFDRKFHTCENIELEVQQTTTLITVNKLNYFCSTWEMQWGKVELQVVNGELFQEGIKIGNVTPQGIKVSFLDLENHLTEIVEFKIINGVLHLYDELKDLQTQRTYTKVEGELGKN